jgi:uncharacterized protein
MNLVKTYLDKSSIHGIGLFANQFIPKGTLIWEFGGLDKCYNQETFGIFLDQLNKIEKEYFMKYSSFKNGKVIWYSDDNKYSNHSDEANTYSTPSKQFAKQDISVGEEITTNYFEIDDNFKGYEN